MSRKEFIGKSIDEYSDYKRIKAGKSIIASYKALLVCMIGIAYPSKETMLLSLASALNVILKDTDTLYSKKDNNIFYIRNCLEGIKLEQRYINFLKDLASFCIKAGWDNEMKVFSGISYMLEKGYLSCEKQFIVSNDFDTIGETMIFEGSSVILGAGVCRHLNTFLFELLAILGYNVRPYSMRVDNNLECLKCSELNADNYESKSTKGNNHLVVIFSSENNSYGLDLMNNSIFMITNELKIKNGTEEFKVRYEKEFNSSKIVSKHPLKLMATSQVILDKRLKDYYDIQKSCVDLELKFQKFYEIHKTTYHEMRDLKMKIHSKIKFK